MTFAKIRYPVSAHAIFPVTQNPLPKGDRLVRRQGRELIYEVKPLPLQTIWGQMDALVIKLKGD